MTKKTRGFTLIELLVVIAIIGNSDCLAVARCATGSRSCPPNAMQKQPQATWLGVAQLHDVFNTFAPGAVHSSVPRSGGAGTTSFGPSFYCALLPYVEQAPLYAQLLKEGRSPGYVNESAGSAGAAKLCNCQSRWSDELFQMSVERWPRDRK